MIELRPVVVGGGPAGAACAIHLARAGAAPLIVERARVPRDALCGGFLSWRTLDQIETLGLPRSALGGHAVRHLRFVSGGRARTIALPRAAMGLSRKRLDTLLLSRARDAGAEVRHATARLDGDRVRLDDGEPLSCESLFVATGKHDLRGLPRPRKSAGTDPMTGLRWRLPAHRTLQALVDDSIEMHLFDGGYAGLVLHEDGSANLCMAVRKSRLAAADGNPVVLLAQLGAAESALAERLAFLDEPERFDAVGHVPYHWRASESRAGVFRLGDQAGVIASLAGEGIGIALASAAEAVKCWQRGGAAAAHEFQSRFAARLRRPLWAARAVAHLGERHGGLTANLAGLPGALNLVARATRI